MTWISCQSKLQPKTNLLNSIHNSSFEFRDPRIDVEWRQIETPMYAHMSRINRFTRHNSHQNHHHQQHSSSSNSNNHHHNHHRVPDDLLLNSAEAHSYEGLSEEILASSSNQAHKKRHFKHKLEHSLRKTSTEKLSRDNFGSQETV